MVRHPGRRCLDRAGRYAAIGAALTFCSTWAAAKTLGPFASEDGSFEATIGPASEAAADQGLPLNRVFSLDVVIESRRRGVKPDLSQLMFDGRMPAHDHGLVTKPVTTKTGHNVFRIDGVKFHMPGRWNLSIRCRHGKEFINFFMPLMLE